MAEAEGGGGFSQPSRSATRRWSDGPPAGQLRGATWPMPCGGWAPPGLMCIVLGLLFFIGPLYLLGRIKEQLTIWSHTCLRHIGLCLQVLSSLSFPTLERIVLSVFYSMLVLEFLWTSFQIKMGFVCSSWNMGDELWGGKMGTINPWDL